MCLFWDRVGFRNDDNAGDGAVAGVAKRSPDAERVPGGDYTAEHQLHRRGWRIPR